MWKRKWAILAAAALLFASLVANALRPTHEPTYLGHRLRYWVLEIQPSSYAAFDAIGTNSIPYLLKWISYESPAWRFHLVINLPDDTPDSVRSWIVSSARLRLAYGAIEVFRRLGTTAAPAIPMLSQIASIPDKPQTADRAVRALAAVGTNAIPALLQIIANPNHPQRPTAALAIIDTVHKDSPDSARIQKTILPHLLRCLTDNQGEASDAAARALAYFPHQAEEMVPALVNCLQSTNLHITETAIISLGQLGSNAVPAISAIAKLVTGSNSEVSILAQIELHHIAPTIYTNTPAPTCALPDGQGFSPR